HNGEDLHFPIRSSSGFSSPFAFLFSKRKTKRPPELCLQVFLFTVKYPFGNLVLLLFPILYFQSLFGETAFCNARLVKQTDISSAYSRRPGSQLGRRR